MRREYELQGLENELKIVYRGTVIDVFPNSYTCTVSTGHGVKYSGLSFGKAGMYANSFESYIPEVGTPVLLIKSAGTVEILKFMPPKGRGEPNYPVTSYTRVNSNTETENNTSKDFIYQAGQPIGTLQGDYVVGNSEGSYLAILRGGMVQIGTGPNSSLFTFSMDDLVRLVSRNYQHFHDAGTLQISNDEGEVTTERYHSMMYFETLGEEAEGSDISVDDSDPNTMRKKKTPFDRTARSRLHEFTGWLGDAFHLFITKRPETNSRLDPQTPKGVAEIFIGQDGAIRVRSAREITLEKVGKIRVPKKVREPWMNKKGDTSEKGYERTPHEIYEWDEEEGAGKSLQQVEKRVHDVDHEELRHFKDHEKDWNVKSEKDSPLPEPGKDIYEGSAEEEFYETTAMVTLRNDGSVYVEDAWGSHIEMTHEDLILGARRDIKLIAGRDMTVMAGRDATIRGTEYVDIVAHKKDLRLKGNKKAMLFADSGAASVDSGKGGKTIINARDGKLLLRSEKDDLVVHADQKELKLLAVKDNIKIRAKQNVQILADEGKLTGYGESKVGFQSPNEAFFAVGPKGSDPEMDAESRQCNGKTNTPQLTDSGNVADIDPKVYLKLDKSIYHLDCIGDPRICKFSNKYAVNDIDSDDKNVSELCCGRECCTVPHCNCFVESRIQKGDHVWTIPAGAVAPNDSVEGPVADENKEEFAEGRFHWRESPRDDIKTFETVWGHQGDDSIEYSTQEWNSDKYDPDSQEVPDAGMQRPIQGDEQNCDEDSCGEGQKKEQVPPFSGYKRYTDGTMSWEDGVESGQYEENCDFRMPKDDYSQADENNPTGRLAKYPGGSGETNPDPEPAEDDDVVEKPIESDDLS